MMFCSMKPRLLITLVSYKDLPLLRQILAPVEELMGLLPVRVLILDNADDAELAAFCRRNIHKWSCCEIQVEILVMALGTMLCSNMRAICPFSDGAHQRCFLLIQSKLRLWWKPWRRMKAWFKPGAKVHFGILLRACEAHYRFSWDYGAKATSLLRPWSGEVDRGQYDGALGKVFGVSGAIFMIRSSVFPALHGGTDQLLMNACGCTRRTLIWLYRLLLAWCKNPDFSAGLGLACTDFGES